jgi:hypothetical protein
MKTIGTTWRTGSYHFMLRKGSFLLMKLNTPFVSNAPVVMVDG